MRPVYFSPTLAPLGLAALLLATNGLAVQGPAWSVAQGEVRVVCPMTVGGSFEAQTTSLAGTLA